jgi:hypothetical protein
MNRILLVALFCLLAARTVFAQDDKDSIVNKMPLVNGKLVYADSVKVKGRDKVKLDSTVKKWFGSYFKYQSPDTLSKDKDVNSSVLSQGALEFKMSPSSLGLVKYDFYLIMTIKIDCYSDYYSFKIYNIFFTLKSGLFRAAGYYQTSPEYLIGLLSKKHIGVGPSVNMGRKKIREYLTNTNDTIQGCITSLNNAMAN